LETVNVECYSGGRFAERPVAFTWRGERFSVEAVERAWRTPDGLAFVVHVADGRRFKLVYTIASDQWTLELSGF